MYRRGGSMRSGRFRDMQGSLGIFGNGVCGAGVLQRDPLRDLVVALASEGDPVFQHRDERRRSALEDQAQTGSPRTVRLHRRIVATNERLDLLDVVKAILGTHRAPDWVKHPQNHTIAGHYTALVTNLSACRQSAPPVVQRERQHRPLRGVQVLLHHRVKPAQSSAPDPRPLRRVRRWPFAPPEIRGSAFGLETTSRAAGGSASHPHLGWRRASVDDEDRSVVNPDARAAHPAVCLSAIADRLRPAMREDCERAASFVTACWLGQAYAASRRPRHVCPR